MRLIKSVVAATPPPASAAASVRQLPPGTGSQHGSSSSRARSHDVPQPAFPVAPSVGRQPSAPSPTHHPPPHDPSDTESSDLRGPRPPPGPPSSGPSAPGSILADAYRSKGLSLVKIDSLPRDAAQFRRWKNAFVTRLCSIDKTSKDTVLHWVMPAFEVASVGDLSDPGLLPPT